MLLHSRHVLQIALITRALCWRLSLAMGASAQARRVSADLRLRAEASEKFEQVLDTANKDLELVRRHHQVALNEISKLRLEVEELDELRRRHDEECSELMRVRSKHAEEMETAQKEFNESRGRLIKEAAEERNRLSRMLIDSEDKIQQLNNSVASKDDRIKWDQGMIAKLREDLSLSKEEVNNMRSKIKGLRETVDRVKTDKVRALDKIEELTEVIARWEAGV